MSGEFRFLPEQASSFAGDVDLLYAFLWGVSGVYFAHDDSPARAEAARGARQQAILRRYIEVVQDVHDRHARARV